MWAVRLVWKLFVLAVIAVAWVYIAAGSIVIVTLIGGLMFVGILVRHACKQ